MGRVLFVIAAPKLSGACLLVFLSFDLLYVNFDCVFADRKESGMWLCTAQPIYEKATTANRSWFVMETLTALVPYSGLHNSKASGHHYRVERAAIDAKRDSNDRPNEGNRWI
jgi:hypothetical protein